ncbi:MAG: glyoxalase superfamily protein [Bdellovibrionales bacterium]
MCRIESLKIKAKLLQKSKKKNGKPIQLKEAFEILAKASGYSNWRAMKESVDQYSLFRPQGVSLPYWNNWYSSYEEAKQHQKKNSDYLIPYEQQFFLCGIDYIEALGIDRNDPDLALVGYDWFAPQDKDAFQRIKAKIVFK